MISIIAEIRSVLHRENGGAKISNTSAFKGGSTADLRRTADIYLRSQSCGDLHNILIEQINRVETLMQDNALL